MNGLALFAIFTAWFIGFAVIRGRDASAFAMIVFPIGLLLACLLLGYIFKINAEKILGVIGLGILCTLVAAFFWPTKRSRKKPAGGA